MVRDDYQVGVTFSVGKNVYKILSRKGSEVVLEYYGGGTTTWSITPSEHHLLISPLPCDGPYSNIINKIRAIKTRRESLGYIY